MSLPDLSMRANLAVNFASKIEASKDAPTLMSLIKLFEALDTDVTEFSTHKAASHQQMVFKKEEMCALREVARTWWPAFPSRRDFKITLTYDEYAPESRVKEMERHRTDLCGYVLDGSLSLEMPELGTLVAEHGDAFYLKAGQTHVLQDPSIKPLRMVVAQLKQ